MRRAARLLFRAVAFGLLRVSRLVERWGKSLAVATFTRAEVDTLSVAEWEAFGENGTVVGHEPFAWETEFFSRQIRDRESVLVVGAGTGRDVIPLLEAGHAVTALDIAPRALDGLSARAKARGLTIEIIHASIVTADLAPGAFDVVLFSWLCFGFLHGEEERCASLVRSKAALRRGGRILLSYPLETVDPKGSPETALSLRFGRAMARLLGGFEAGRSDLFNLTGTSTRPSVFFIHFFRASDIELAARRAGLVVTFQAEPNGAIGIAALMRPSEAPR